MPFFDTFADAEPTGPGKRIMLRLNQYHVRVLRSLSPEASFAVEIGPGLAPFADACRASDIDYLAIEANDRLADGLEKRGFRVERSTVPPVPLEDGAACIFHASHVIEHNPTFVQAVDFVAEARRVLRRGGLLSLVAPDFDHLGDEFWRTHYSHSLPINMRRLVQLVSDGGFTVRHDEYLSGPFGLPLRLLTAPAAKLASVGLLRLLSLGWLSAAQAYSAKMTFMRAVWVVAEKRD